MIKSGIYKKGEKELIKLIEHITNKKTIEKSGAITIFIGVARSKGRKDKEVKTLVMESYEEHANRTINQICKEVNKKFKTNFVTICHFIGEFETGEPIVFAAVGGKHRKESFLALEEAVERYKKEPALFKKEVYLDGTQKWMN